MNLSIEDRAERLNRMISESRIIRNDWTGLDEQGRETACLLAALSPEVGEAENPRACPAAVMPPWLAYLTPWLDDNCSDAEWPRMIRRYAACANLWSTLDDAAWRRVEIAARRAAVEEAMRRTTDERTLAACHGALVWLDADMPESSRVDVKEAASEAAAKTPAGAAAFAAWAAADATAEAAALAVETAKYEAADRITDAILSALEKECGL